MAATSVDVLSVTRQFGSCLRNCLSSGTLDSDAAFTTVESAFSDVAKYDQETKRILLDQSFRDCLTNGYLSPSSKDSHPDLTKCRFLLELAIVAAKKEMCSSTLPIVIMSDIFDVLSLDRSEQFFACVEENVSVWKGPVFFTAIKNNLLRICNDLLRRLSRSQNTVFCGRILLFLARFFPFSERSGLNVISEFNLDNTTAYRMENEEKATADDMEVEAADEEKEKTMKIEEDSKNLNIDYALYSKFWQIQDFFRNPVQCYNEEKWLTFSRHAQDVMDTFKSFKIDSVSGRKKAKTAGEEAAGDATAAAPEEQSYFAKYLTNQNLLQLQLSDSNFRRYILVQFLILYQYLQSAVKFKTERQVLSEDQLRWIADSTKLVYDLVGETPPDGKRFCDSVRHILKREEQWNTWKNEGCPAFSKPSKAESNGAAAAAKVAVVGGDGTRKRKAKLGDQMRDATANKRFMMGNAELTRLWNVCPDNYEAASSPERDFLPDLDAYMAEAMEQLDPKNQVEKEYQKIYDGQWGWRALRLLAKKSPHFFTYGNNPIGKLPEYLEAMLKKRYPSLKSGGAASAKASNGEAKKDGETAEQGSEPAAAAPPAVCTEDQLKALATNLKDQWRKLVPKLGLSKEDVADYEKKESDEPKRALLMLTKWAKDEGEGATRDDITYILDGLKMSQVAEGVF